VTCLEAGGQTCHQGALGACVHVAVGLFASLFERDPLARSAAVGRNRNSSRGARQTANHRAVEAYSAPSIRKPNAHHRRFNALCELHHQHVTRLTKGMLELPKRRQSWEHEPMGGPCLALDERERKLLENLSGVATPPGRGTVADEDTAATGVVDEMLARHVGGVRDDKAMVDDDSALSTSSSDGPPGRTPAGRGRRKRCRSAGAAQPGVTSSPQAPVRRLPTAIQMLEAAAADNNDVSDLSSQDLAWLSVCQSSSSMSRAGRVRRQSVLLRDRDTDEFSPSDAAETLSDNEGHPGPSPSWSGAAPRRPGRANATRAAGAAALRPAPRRSAKPAAPARLSSFDSDFRRACEESFALSQLHDRSSEAGRRLLAELGFTVACPVRGDGACLMRSIAVLQQEPVPLAEPISCTRHRQLRTNALTYASVHKVSLQPFVSAFQNHGSELDKALAKEANEDRRWDIYLAGMGKDNEYADPILLLSLAESLECNIFTLTLAEGTARASIQYCVANDDVASGVSTYCVLNHRDVHFEPLLWKGGRRVRQQELLDFEQEVSLKIRELQPQLFSGADAEVLSLVRSRLA